MDSNQRPLAPHASALPDYATPRFGFSSNGLDVRTPRLHRCQPSAHKQERPFENYASICRNRQNPGYGISFGRLNFNMKEINKLILWSEQHHSHLPWRKKRSHYRTLVSEIMLQQTTVATVLSHFERFVSCYPDIKSLASSTNEEICIAWKGLGYYRRARNLLKAARFMTQKCGGKIPLKYEQLVTIPGIGDYTASALIAMGRDQRALCIDANIERVTCRLFGIQMAKGPKLRREIKERWDKREIYPGNYSYRKLNEALMDLGRTICQANKADCTLCPMNSGCVTARGNPLALPLRCSRKESIPLALDLVRCVTKKGGRVLVYQKEERHWLAGQYELPTFILKSQDPTLKQYPPWQEEKMRPITTLKSAITKYRITNHVIPLAESKVRQLYQGHGKLLYKKPSASQNLSHITFKILKKLTSLSQKKPSRE